MPVNVIGTLKPKNNGKFPVAEAVDIKVEGDLRLDEVLENKADLETLNYALANKADKTTAAALQSQIDEISQSQGAGTADTEIAQARVGADGTSYGTLKARLDAESEDAVYPFKTVSSTNGKTAVKSIIDFKFYADDTTKSVKLMRILRNTANVYAVTIAVNGTNYNILNIASSSYTEKSYNKFKISGVGYGYFIIDWSALTSGTDYASINAELKQIYKIIPDENALRPFELTMDSTKDTAVNAILNFAIHLKDPSQTVKLRQVIKNSSNVYAIKISIGGTDYNILNSGAYTEKSYNEFTIDGVAYGYYVINWNGISSGSIASIESELKPIFKEDYAEEVNEVNLLPFENVQSTTNNKIVNAFSDFVIHMNDTSKSVKLKLVMKNHQNAYAIRITIDNTDYLVLNVPAASYSEKSYNEFNIANVAYGYFVIDWSAFSNGAYDLINSELKQIFKTDYKEYETPKYNNVEILLPNTINVTVGKEISLEYYNIVRCTNIEEFQVDVVGTNSQIENLGTRLRIAPISAGTTSLTLRLYKNDVLITSKSFNVVATADTKPTIKAIFIGDSMTNAAVYLSELVNMLGTDKITLYGTRNNTAADSDGNARSILHEGRSGWSTANYVNDASVSDVVNAFYNNGFDFSYYIENNPSFSDVTDVFILLGTNDGAGNGFETRYKAICDSIKEYNSSIRIHCMLPAPPAKDGYAFGIRNNISYITFKNYMFNNAKTILNMYQGESGYSIVPINANLDCWYDFPQTEVAANSRNPQLITVLNDNVHPSKYGYYRFADVIYCDIIANCQ